MLKQSGTSIRSFESIDEIQLAASPSGGNNSSRKSSPFNSRLDGKEGEKKTDEERSAEFDAFLRETEGIRLEAPVRGRRLNRRPIRRSVLPALSDSLATDSTSDSGSVLASNSIPQSEIEVAASDNSLFKNRKPDTISRTNRTPEEYSEESEKIKSLLWKYPYLTEEQLKCPFDFPVTDALQRLQASAMARNGMKLLKAEPRKDDSDRENMMKLVDNRMSPKELMALQEEKLHKRDDQDDSSGAVSAAISDEELSEQWKIVHFGRAPDPDYFSSTLMERYYRTF